MAENLTITVNGEKTDVAGGTILLDHLKEMGIVVPTLCHDERLTPYGGCRLCVVARRDGRGGLVPACSTPVQRGMVIETDPPEVIEARRRQLQLLVLNHRMECPSCIRAGDCRFQDLIFEYGSPEERLPFELVRAPINEKSQVIVRDPEKCIICGKCVRICDEVQGVAAIEIVNRGLEARVATMLERPLDCEFCGQCVNACPVGALTAKPYSAQIPYWHRDAVTTTCSFCSCGCQIKVETHDHTIQRVTSDVNAEPNHGKLCAKGWLGWDIALDAGRIEKPLVRKEGKLVEVGWEEALAEVAGVVQAARKAERPVVSIGNPRMTCEDAYLLQRYMRSVVGSPHVDVGPVGGPAALLDGVGAITGTPRSTATFEDLASAELVLVLCGDPTRTHPLVKTELVQGVHRRGQKLIVAHALSGGLENHADLYLRLEPGAEEILAHGIAAQLAKDIPPEADCRKLPGFDGYLASLDAFSPDRVEDCVGVSAEQVVELARKIASARKVVTVIVTGLGIPGDEDAVTRAATQLMAILDTGEREAGLLVLGEKANVQGVLDVGLDSSLLPGNRPAGDETVRNEVENLWDCAALPGSGWSAQEACSRAIKGEVGVMHLIGQDPLGAWPDSYRSREALQEADFLVVQDAFLTQTARMADVVLPVRILGDRDGTLVGADGVRRKVNRVAVPASQLPQDGQLFVDLARRLGTRLPEGEELEKELGHLVTWPHGKSKARRFEDAGPLVKCEQWSDMLMDNSPQLFHSGSVTKRSRQLLALSPTMAVRLCPADAGELGLKNGDTVRIATGERGLLLLARLDRTVRRGTVIVPWQCSKEDSASTLVTEVGTPLAVTIRGS